MRKSKKAIHRYAKKSKKATRSAKRGTRAATFHRTTDGPFQSATTSLASMDVIERAMVSYRHALKRLADR